MFRNSAEDKLIKPIAEVLEITEKIATDQVGNFLFGLIGINFQPKENSNVFLGSDGNLHFQYFSLNEYQKFAIVRFQLNMFKNDGLIISSEDVNDYRGNLFLVIVNRNCFKKRLNLNKKELIRLLPTTPILTVKEKNKYTLGTWIFQKLANTSYPYEAQFYCNEIVARLIVNKPYSEEFASMNKLMVKHFSAPNIQYTSFSYSVSSILFYEWIVPFLIPTHNQLFAKEKLKSEATEKDFKPDCSCIIL